MLQLNDITNRIVGDLIYALFAKLNKIISTENDNMEAYMLSLNLENFKKKYQQDEKVDEKKYQQACIDLKLIMELSLEYIVKRESKKPYTIMDCLVDKLNIDDEEARKASKKITLFSSKQQCIRNGKKQLIKNLTSDLNYILTIEKDEKIKGKNHANDDDLIVFRNV